MLHSILEVLGILSVDWSEQRVGEILPHFLSFKQKDDVIFLVFELFNVLASNEGSEFFESTVCKIRHKVVNIRLGVHIFHSFFIVTGMLLCSSIFGLSSRVLMIFIFEGFLEDIDLAFDFRMIVSL